MIHLIRRRRRRVIGPLVALLIAGMIFVFTGRVNLDPLNQSSHRRGSGIYIGGFRIGGGQDGNDQVKHVSNKPQSNLLFGESATGESPVIGSWPPQVGAFYPDLILSDQNGDRFQLSDLAGKVILLELAAVPCSGCQAFAGGNELAARLAVSTFRRVSNRFTIMRVGSRDWIWQGQKRRARPATSVWQIDEPSDPGRSHGMGRALRNGPSQESNGAAR